MNENRHNDKLYFLGKTDNSLMSEWDGLLVLLGTLEQKARSLNRFDLVSLIIKQRTIIKNNKPNKKLYRSVLKHVNDIEQSLSGSGRVR